MEDLPLRDHALDGYQEVVRGGVLRAVPRRATWAAPARRAARHPAMGARQPSRPRHPVTGEEWK